MAISLKYEGKILAILNNPEFYKHHKEERCSRQWGTAEKGHPYIKVIITSHLVVDKKYRLNYSK